MPSCRVVLLACLAAAGLAALWAPCNLDTERLRGRRVVVCGASVGIGKEIALQYSAHGAEVLLVARRQGVLEEVAEECRKAGAKAVHVVSSATPTTLAVASPGIRWPRPQQTQLPWYMLPPPSTPTRSPRSCRAVGGLPWQSAQDLSKAENCQAVIDDAAKYMGGIDTLILNHIVGFWGSWGAVEDPAATLDFYTRINFHSYVLLTTYALDMLEESRGSIAVISSLAGKMGLPRVAPYAATKHALHGFFDSFRHELAENGTDVSITSVFLGNIDTVSC